MAAAFLKVLLKAPSAAGRGVTRCSVFAADSARLVFPSPAASAPPYGGRELQTHCERETGIINITEVHQATRGTKPRLNQLLIPVVCYVDHHVDYTVTPSA